MDFSKLSAAERNAAIAAAVVVVTALISIATGWGPLMWIPLLAGVAALAVIFGSQVMPTVTLPGSNGTLLVLAGGIATLVWVVVVLDWAEYIGENLVNLDTLQFLVGLAAAAFLTWLGWQTLQAEGGRFQLGAASTSSAPAASTEPAPPPPPTADASPAMPAAAAQSGNEPAEAVAPEEPQRTDGDDERTTV
jgi:hypothetical protein